MVAYLWSCVKPYFFFFFQAEDGIRDLTVTGVQTCALPISQGYRGLRELVCHKYRVFEGLEVTPENIFVANGSGHALSLAFGAFVDPGDPIICEAPTFSGSLNNIRRHGPEILDVPVDADGLVTSVVRERLEGLRRQGRDRKSTRLNSSHSQISYAVFCLKKKKK